MKASGTMVKHKLSRKIVHSAYCQVFNRDEETVPFSSVESLLIRFSIRTIELLFLFNIVMQSCRERRCHLYSTEV